MKVVLTQTMCGPEGNAHRGMVVDVSDKRNMQVPGPDGKPAQVSLGEYMIANRLARQFDPQLDAKARHGLIKPER